MFKAPKSGWFIIIDIDFGVTVAVKRVKMVMVFSKYGSSTSRGFRRGIKAHLTEKSCQDSVRKDPWIVLL